MTTSISQTARRAAWQALEAHYPKIRELHLRQPFADDPTRGERMTAEAVGVYLDYAKQRVTGETLGLLVQLAEALAFGKTPREVETEGTPTWLMPHLTFEGNRPSSTLLLERLTPTALGKLVALYEHSVFTQGAMWDVDSFDQWGVELGKALAARIIPELESGAERQLRHDSPTNALMRRYRKSEGLSHGR